MEWVSDLLWNDSSAAHTILMLAVAIGGGIYFGKIKFFGISLGITWVLFVGLILGHFGLTVNDSILHFVKEFGLILFVYSIGMQVGPGFFSSFKKGGLTLNLLAMGVVFLGVFTMLGFYWLTDYPITSMVGILSGAVTNTPGMGAAQQAYWNTTGESAPDIALGYAVAYPLGVVGIIVATILVRGIFRISLEKEVKKIAEASEHDANHFILTSLQLKNPALFGKTVDEITRIAHVHLVVSRIRRQQDGRVELCNTSTILYEDDTMWVATDEGNVESVVAYFGKEVEVDWDNIPSELVSRRILLTKPEINGKRLGSLSLRKLYSVNITRVNRSGVDLLASPSLILQLGDRLTVVGSLEATQKVEEVLGNSMKRLREPNLIPIFIGIALGILLGSIPFRFPGIPQGIKLGLAGGPLIVAILLSRFGPKYKMVTYTTVSANLMLREVGIALFLASVGIAAGKDFVRTVINSDGLAWIGMGVVITMLPLLIIGFIAHKKCKLNYLDIMGLLAGSMTDPPALAYANSSSGSDQPAVAYSTVYPLVMFLRVITAQVIILIFAV